MAKKLYVQNKKVQKLRGKKKKQKRKEIKTLSGLRKLLKVKAEGEASTIKRKKL